MKQFERYTRWIHARFAEEGAPILATYYCPHHPDAGLGALRVECDCRKPKPGMLLRAIHDYAIEAEYSVMIGDTPADMEAAKAAGIGYCMLFDAQGDARIADCLIHTCVATSRAG
jgi:D-glycero-D-manno-heptose 1,7-bisphosphate phosphatase